MVAPTYDHDMRTRVLATVLALLLSATTAVIASPVGAANPGDLSDREFVSRQYEDFLGRAPDAAGLAFWTNELQAGQTPAALIENLVSSPEFERTNAPVIRLYYAHFRRGPDFEGLRFWTDRLANGETLDNVSENFTESAEFQAKYGELENAEYVELVYTNVLDRAADAEGLDYWTGQLESGVTRGTVMALFADSAEFRTKTDGLVKASMLYIGLLHRSPDEGGLTYWAGKIDSGVAYRDIMSSFLGADEYRSRLQSLLTSVHPLTGQLTNDLSNAPALAVKIDNAPRARPQTALSQADIVYEEKVEAGLTRFVAIYQSEAPTEVGPVRSIRTTDFDLLEQFNTPLLAASGANPAILTQLEEEPVVNVNALVAGSAYYRKRGRSIPYNLFASTESLWSAAGDQGGVPNPVFTYRKVGERRLGVAKKTNGVSIDFGLSTASYQWDGTRQGWLRSQNGTPHLEETGNQIAPDNVIVLITDYEPSSADGRSPEAITIGTGKAFVFVEGFLTRGTWSRETADQPMVFKDKNNKVIKLSTGSTWIELAPQGTVTLK